MTQYALKEVEALEVEALFANHPNGSFAQSIPMALVRQDLGRTIKYLAVYDGQELIGACQLSIIKGRFNSADITAGPLIDFNNQALVKFFSTEIKKYLDAQGCIYLTINPYIEYSDEIIATMKKLGWGYSGRIDASAVGIRGGIRWIYVKDLTGLTEENYQATYHKRHRRYIRNHDPKVQVRQLERNELGAFLGIMRHTSERRQFSNRADSYFYSLYDHFGDGVKYLVAELHDEDKVIPIAAIAFIESNGEVISFLGGALSEYAKYRGSYLLHDYMIGYSVAKHYKRYNFYGIEGKIEDPNSPGYGIYEFKAKFGTGQPIELIGEFVLPVNKLKYKVLAALKKVPAIGK
jgi:lipid II:glycine glycyltransferase (peptidoglycan interpeptide bridge formation enzyme)